MATANVNGRVIPGISKYRITLFASLTAFVVAVCVLVFAYWQHVELLNQGNQIGRRLEKLGLPSATEGAQHEPR